MSNENTWGGKRDGSGRKVKRDTTTIRVPSRLKDTIKQLTEIIEIADENGYKIIINKID